MAILLYSLDAAGAHVQLLMGQAAGLLRPCRQAGEAGKSTLAKLVATRLVKPVVVPMDGYHFRNRDRGRPGLRRQEGGRSGIPSTVWLHHAPEADQKRTALHGLDHPVFHREIEESDSRRKVSYLPMLNLRDTRRQLPALSPDGWTGELRPSRRELVRGCGR